MYALLLFYKPEIIRAEGVAMKDFCEKKETRDNVLCVVI
jgi:hypothetical protein